ncbi:hypothetical protein MXB_5415 [Myxobolus squamalis]|nr:hypothetical protein MXB_5415 [Myxobolus squamalis]
MYIRRNHHACVSFIKKCIPCRLRTFMIRNYRRIIFHCPDANDYYDDYMQPQHSIFVSSNVFHIFNAFHLFPSINIYVFIYFSLTCTAILFFAKYS